MPASGKEWNIFLRTNQMESSSTQVRNKKIVGRAKIQASFHRKRMGSISFSNGHTAFLSWLLVTDRFFFHFMGQAHYSEALSYLDLSTVWSGDAFFSVFFFFTFAFHSTLLFTKKIRSYLSLYTFIPYELNSLGQNIFRIFYSRAAGTRLSVLLKTVVPFLLHRKLHLSHHALPLRRLWFLQTTRSTSFRVFTIHNLNPFFFTLFTWVATSQMFTCSKNIAGSFFLSTKHSHCSTERFSIVLKP